MENRKEGWGRRVMGGVSGVGVGGGGGGGDKEDNEKKTTMIMIVKIII